MGKHTSGHGVVYSDGEWHDGDAPLISSRAHGMWLGSTVFDGARAFDGVAPDLDRHVDRSIRSAQFMGLAPRVTAEEIEGLVWEGIGTFPHGTELYIRPTFFADDGFVMPDPDTTRFMLVISESPLPSADGFSACRSSFLRPARNMAPTEAKAACLYPNVARGMHEANQKGFDFAIVLDSNGNVAEFSVSNLFMVEGGVVHTPIPNGTFLNGITRQRVIALLRDSGIEVIERSIDFSEVLDADELFTTGNYAKVKPCTRIEDRDLQAGPVFKKARELYFDFARDTGPRGI